MAATPTVFEQRAVAFLDILGFTALINQAEREPSKLAELFGLRTVLDSHVRWNNNSLSSSVPAAVKPRYIFISDSIILSVPLSHPPNFDGLGIVVAKTIEIAHKLLEMGFLLRGGIAIGSVWHDDRNIFGTGYISAVNGEKSADHPRIVLSDEAKAHWQASNLAGTSSMCRRDGGSLIVDTLMPFYIRETEIHGRIEEAFSQYRAWIITRLSELRPGSARSKWEWIALAFNRAVTQHDVNVGPIDAFPLPQT